VNNNNNNNKVISLLIYMLIQPLMPFVKTTKRQKQNQDKSKRITQQNQIVTVKLMAKSRL
jgi:hypothetical protein